MKTQNQLRIEVNPIYKQLINDKTEILLLYGGSGCFYAKQLVSTIQGVKRISDIQKGDIVLSYNHKKKKNEYKRVKNTFKYNLPEDRLIKIKMRDGSVIKVTENHEFFYGGTYMKIKDILLSLPYGNMETNTRI